MCSATFEKIISTRLCLFFYVDFERFLFDIFYEGALSAMGIVVGNGLGYLSTNPK